MALMKTVHAWVVAGLALRVLLMPLTIHGDLIFTHAFPYYLSSQGIWDIYGYLGGHFLKQGFSYYAPLVYYTVAFFQFCLRLFHADLAPLMQEAHRVMLNYAGDTETILKAFSGADIMRYAFLMKIPYLFSDAICVWLILKLFKSAEIATRALQLWLFSPVLLFSVYVFGTYRIFPALLLWALLILVRDGRVRWAAAVIGTLCLMDNFPWLLCLPAVWILGRDWKERFVCAGILLTVFGVLFIPLYFSSHGFVVYAYVSPLFQKAAMQSLTRHFAPLVSSVAKMFFIFSYFVLLGFLVSRKSVGQENRMRLFIHVNLCVLLLFYATSQTLAHYFMWALPLFVFIQAEGEPWHPALSWFLIGLLFLFNLDSRALNLGLFRPVLTDAMSYPSFHEWVGAYPWGYAVAASRILFSFLCVFFIWRIVRLRIQPLLGGS